MKTLQAVALRTAAATMNVRLPTKRLRHIIDAAGFVRKQGKVEGDRIMGLRLTDTIAVVAIATLVGTVVYGMWTGNGITFDSGYGKVVIGGDDNAAIGKPAEPGKARPDTNGTVWEAECPEKTRPISGSCIVGESGGKGLLRSIGIDRVHNGWHCVYSETMTDVFVDAVCVDVD